MATPEVIAIVGPTASGKTALAIEVAERWNGEIVCADSRTIYTGMDIGTAKPTPEEQARVRHWGLDIVEPGQPFSAADFQRYGRRAIADIRGRGKLPVIVGGTGLYVDGLLYDFQFGTKSDLDQRRRFEALSIEELQDHCKQNNIPLPENQRNKRFLIRAIEQGGVNRNRHNSLPVGWYIVGITTPMEELRTRIVTRSEHLFDQDVEAEARILGEKYGWESEAMTGNIYPLIKKHLDGELTKNEVKERFATADYRLAKRQMTWLRRNPDIMWVTRREAADYIDRLLAA